MDPSLHRIFVHGRNEYRAGRFLSALPALRQVVAAHGDFADVHNMLGVISHQNGDRSAAVRHFERALDLNPYYVEAALHLSICYGEEGRYDEARRIYSRASRSRGSEREASLNHLDELSRAKLANMHCEVGDTYAALGLPGRAVREYEAALSSGVRYPDIRLKMAKALRDLGRLNDSLAELVRLREEKPGYLPARLQLGILLWAVGRLSEARAEWDYVLSREPDNRLATFYKAAVDARRAASHLHARKEFPNPDAQEICDSGWQATQTPVLVRSCR